MTRVMSQGERGDDKNGEYISDITLKQNWMNPTNDMCWNTKHIVKILNKFISLLNDLIQ